MMVMVEEMVMVVLDRVKGLVILVMMMMEAPMMINATAIPTVTAIVIVHNEVYFNFDGANDEIRCFIIIVITLNVYI